MSIEDIDALKLNMNSCRAIAWQWIFHLSDVLAPTVNDIIVYNFPDAIGLFAVLASLRAD